MNERANKMFDITVHAVELLHEFAADNTIEICYFHCSEYHREIFNPWQWERLHLIEGDEFFLIYRGPVRTGEYLYTVNVTGDSYLTAAAELTRFIANKF